MAHVSILLPTYNRARFLPDAFEAIDRQTHGAWDLVVVDDGSTDATRALIEQYQRRTTRPVTYVHQENRGAYGARNTALDHATGPYVAFFDSDDLWLPHHLERSVEALEAHPEIDWVYGACQCVAEATGAILQPTTFEVDGRPRPFRALHARTADNLHVIDDPGVLECQLKHGLYAGLQNSVIRLALFEGRRFWEEYRVVEDVLFLVRVLAEGARLAYIPDVHVIYRVHGGNSSASAEGASARRLLPIFEEEVRGLERIARECHLPAAALRVLRGQLAHSYFWRLGYAGYWRTGERDAAFRSFRAGLRLRPWDPWMWKTYLACASRARLANARAES